MAVTEIGYHGSATLTFTLVGDVLTLRSLSSNGGELGAPVFDQIAGPAIWLSAPFVNEP